MGKERMMSIMQFIVSLWEDRNYIDRILDTVFSLFGMEKHPFWRFDIYADTTWWQHILKSLIPSVILGTGLLSAIMASILGTIAAATFVPELIAAALVTPWVFVPATLAAIPTLFATTFSAATGLTISGAWAIWILYDAWRHFLPRNLVNLILWKPFHYGESQMH